MPEWAGPALSILGALAGGYAGVRISVTRLETQMENVLTRLTQLGDRTHSHAQRIQENAMKIAVLERRLDDMEKDQR